MKLKLIVGLSTVMVIGVILIVGNTVNSSRIEVKNSVAESFYVANEEILAEEEKETETEIEFIETTQVTTTEVSETVDISVTVEAIDYEEDFSNYLIQNIQEGTDGLYYGDILDIKNCMEEVAPEAVPPLKLISWEQNNITLFDVNNDLFVIDIFTKERIK